MLHVPFAITYCPLVWTKIIFAFVELTVKCLNTRFVMLNFKTFHRLHPARLHPVLIWLWAELQADLTVESCQPSMINAPQSASRRFSIPLILAMKALALVCSLLFFIFFIIKTSLRISRGSWWKCNRKGMRKMGRCAGWNKCRRVSKVCSEKFCWIVGWPSVLSQSDKSKKISWSADGHAMVLCSPTQWWY